MTTVEAPGGPARDDFAGRPNAQMGGRELRPAEGGRRDGLRPHPLTGSGARNDGDALGSVAVVCVWLPQYQGPRGR
jgi:hypothetical protein